MKNKTVAKILSGVFLGIISALLVWILVKYLAPDLFYSFEAKTYDWRIIKSIADRPKTDVIEDIVIIDFDGRSVSELGKFSQWPRSYYPKVINFLNEGGAKVIGLDVIFDKDIREPEEDVNFVQSVSKAQNITNAILFSQSDSLNWRYEMKEEPKGFEWQKFAHTLKPEEKVNFYDEERMDNEFIDLLNAGSSVGHINFNSDVDGVVRKIFLFTNFNNNSYASFAFQLYMDIKGINSINIEPGEQMDLFSDGKLITSVPIDEKGNMLINYFGGFKTFRYISFFDVLMGEERIPKEYFKDKIVLIGTSLPGLFDLRTVPVQPAFPGVEIHANILQTLLTQKYIYQFSELESFLLLTGVGIIAGIITVLLTPLWSIIIVLFLALLHTIISGILFFELNLWVAIINPLLTLLITFSSVYLYRYITEEKGKKFIKETFSHFVTQSVVDELLANPDKIKLGGEKKVCTVFFSDVAGFTTISEKLTPEALVRLLNQYLTEMTNIVFKYDGMLDKYEGDAIMAVFGAPIAHGNHAYKCCAAALEMQEKLVLLRNLWVKQGNHPLHVRCGINTGPMVVGNMGSENRFDYTVMGDSVNLGARLEPANKEYDTLIMIGQNTYEMAKEEIIVRQLDLLRVKGKTAPIKVYELVGLKEKGITEEKS
ncbi:CHASE2 domain-containing protein, partial [Calditrichota bacterium]